MKRISTRLENLNEIFVSPIELVGVALVISAIFLVSGAQAEQTVSVQVKNPSTDQSDAFNGGSWSSGSSFFNRDRDPFEEMADMQSRIHQMFEDSMNYFPRQTMAARKLTERTSSMAMDMMETPTDFLIMCDVPGIPKENVTVEVQGNLLSVRGERGEEWVDKKDEEGYRMYWSERGYGAFERTVQLPDAADTSKITAEHKDGQLTIHIPKLAEKKPVKVQIV